MTTQEEIEKLRKKWNSLYAEDRKLTEKLDEIESQMRVISDRIAELGGIKANIVKE